MTGDVYYFNFSTGQSTWDHPCDEQYRRLVLQEREKAQARVTPAKKEKEKKKKKERKKKDKMPLKVPAASAAPLPALLPVYDHVADLQMGAPNGNIFSVRSGFSALVALFIFHNLLLFMCCIALF